MQMTTSKIEKFLNGAYPPCKKAPHGTHVKLAGMGIKPRCLYCKKTMATT